MPGANSVILCPTTVTPSAHLSAHHCVQGASVGSKFACTAARSKLGGGEFPTPTPIFLCRPARLASLFAAAGVERGRELGRQQLFSFCFLELCRSGSIFCSHACRNLGFGLPRRRQQPLNFVFGPRHMGPPGCSSAAASGSSTRGTAAVCQAGRTPSLPDHGP